MVQKGKTMSKTTTYFLNVKDVMRGYSLSLDYETMRELAEAYNRYSNDTDYEVLSMHSTQIATDIIQPEKLQEIFDDLKIRL